MEDSAAKTGRDTADAEAMTALVITTAKVFFKNFFNISNLLHKKYMLDIL